MKIQQSSKRSGKRLSASTALLVLSMIAITTCVHSLLIASDAAKRYNSQLSSTLKDDESDKKIINEPVEFAHFNPISCKALDSEDSASGFFMQTSLRRIRMQELNNELIEVVGDEAATQSLLEDYQDYLLEPLEDLQAFLDPASVYTHDMSREERYQQFRESTDQRLVAVKASDDHHEAQWALQSIRDFVLSFE